MRYLLFDFDGTVVDSKDCAIKATTEAFAEFSLPIPAEAQITSLMGVPIEKSFAMLAGAERYAAVDETKLFERFRLKYSLYSETHVSLFAGMREVLQACQKAEMPAAIVSSKKRSVVEKNCADLGIEGLFKAVIGSDSVWNYKPHPEPVFKALIELSASDIRQAIMFGDASVDIEMGHAAGVATCAVTWGAHSEAELRRAQPRHVVHTPGQITQLLLSPDQMSIGISSSRHPAR